MHAVALHAMDDDNVVEEQRALRTTPAMAAGVTDMLWTIDHIVKIVELYDVKPGQRGPYQTKSV